MALKQIIGHLKPLNPLCSKRFGGFILFYLQKSGAALFFVLALFGADSNGIINYFFSPFIGNNPEWNNIYV